MAKVHIGNKIKEVWKASRIKGTEFATMINKDRQVIYDIFNRETIDTGLLETISKALKHDFFAYYEQQLTALKEVKPDYGYATKAEVSDLAHTILKLTKAVQKIQEQLPLKAAKKTSAKKGYAKGKK